MQKLSGPALHPIALVQSLENELALKLLDGVGKMDALIREKVKIRTLLDRFKQISLKNDTKV